MIPKTLDEMVTELAKNPRETSIYTANYGDGEWGCIMGDGGVNVNGDVYGQGIRDALRLTLEEPLLTWYGYNPGKKLVGRVEEWLRARGFCVPMIEVRECQHALGKRCCSSIGKIEGEGKKLPWMWKEVVSAANCRGEFGPFLRLCRERSVVVVGGPHLLSFTEFPHTYILAPSSNSFDQVDAILDQVDGLCYLTQPDLILFACGLASNVLIWELARRQARSHLVDVGAALDPYVGVNSRKTYRTLAFQERLQRSREEAGRNG